MPITVVDWRKQSKRFRHRGHDICYQDEGQGESLLCIHGFPTSSWDWHRLWPDLVTRFRVVAIDMIGFGFSDKPCKYAYSLFDQADLHEMLLRSLNISSCHILAHDYGDTVAQELLARYSERLEGGDSSLILHSVCLLNGGIFPEAIQPLRIQELLAGPLGPFINIILPRTLALNRLRSVFGPDTRPTDSELADLGSIIDVNQGRRILHKVIRYMKERVAHRDRWVDALQNTAVPLRLVAGMLDPVSGLPVVQRYRELLRKADVIELPGVGHYPQLEQPEAVLHAFLDFHTKI